MDEQLNAGKPKNAWDNRPKTAEKPLDIMQITVGVLFIP